MKNTRVFSINETTYIMGDLAGPQIHVVNHTGMTFVSLFRRKFAEQ
jgi:hypothetical protein